MGNGGGGGGRKVSEWGEDRKVSEWGWGVGGTGK